MSNEHALSKAISDAFDKMLEVINQAKTDVLGVMGGLETLVTKNKGTFAEALNEVSKNSVSKLAEHRTEVDFAHVVLRPGGYLRVEGGVIPSYNLEGPINYSEFRASNDKYDVTVPETGGDVYEFLLPDNVIKNKHISNITTGSEKVIAPEGNWVVVEDNGGILADPPVRIDVKRADSLGIQRDVYIRFNRKANVDGVVKLKTLEWDGLPLTLEVVYEALYDIERWLNGVSIVDGVLTSPAKYMNGEMLDRIVIRGAGNVGSPYRSAEPMKTIRGGEYNYNLYELSTFEQTNTNVAIKPEIIGQSSRVTHYEYHVIEEIEVTYKGQTYRRVFDEVRNKRIENDTRLEQYVSGLKVETEGYRFRIVSDAVPDIESNPILVTHQQSSYDDDHSYESLVKIKLPRLTRGTYSLNSRVLVECDYTDVIIDENVVFTGTENATPELRISGIGKTYTFDSVPTGITNLKAYLERKMFEHEALSALSPAFESGPLSNMHLPGTLDNHRSYYDYNIRLTFPEHTVSELFNEISNIDYYNSHLNIIRTTNTVEFTVSDRSGNYGIKYTLNPEFDASVEVPMIAELVGIDDPLTIFKGNKQL